MKKTHCDFCGTPIGEGTGEGGWFSHSSNRCHQCNNDPEIVVEIIRRELAYQERQRLLLVNMGLCGYLEHGESERCHNRRPCSEHGTKVCFICGAPAVAECATSIHVNKVWPWMRLSYCENHPQVFDSGR